MIVQLHNMAFFRHSCDLADLLFAGLELATALTLSAHASLIVSRVV